MIAAGALIVIETVTSPRSIPPNSVCHVLQRVDRDALAPDLAERARMVGVVAHQRRHVERRREAGLAVVDQVAEALVRLLGGAEAGELPHRPQPAAVHRLVHAARERVLARAGRSRSGVRQVGRRVERLDRLPRERRERVLALRHRSSIAGRQAASTGRHAALAHRHQERLARAERRHLAHRHRAPGDQLEPEALQQQRRRSS